MRFLQKWWVRTLLAMLLAWLCVPLCVFIWMRGGCPWVIRANVEQYDLPAERVLQVPKGGWYIPPPHLASPVPVVEMREFAPAQYELLYWGNPVLPSYAYRIRNIMSGESVLLSASLQPEPLRPLPVPCPRRGDARLPLQPALPIGRLASAPGGFVAVCVEVLDARQMVVLCKSEYLLRCPEQ